jgi:polyketide cyclase/dehydrase/lipid transport protein
MSGNTLHAEASAHVSGSAADVYRMIADYRVGHARIIPPRYLRNLRVEEGGHGAGTVISYDVVAFGRTNHARARITEPEPGRVLVETDLDKGAVTSFVVEPIGAAKSRVTIKTDMPTRSGLLGAIERALIRRFLKRVYVAELALLDGELRIDARGLRVLPGRKQPEPKGRKKPRSG